MGGDLDKNDGLSAQTETDLTEKTVNPMGGFNRYGDITTSYVMLKGCTSGVPKRVTVLRKPCVPTSVRDATYVKSIKFIDTSSKQGTGRFQTSAEKESYFAKKQNN